MVTKNFVEAVKLLQWELATAKLLAKMLDEHLDTLKPGTSLPNAHGRAVVS